jgi:hypothetical protein
MTTPHLRKSIGHSPLQRVWLFALALALACFALSPAPKAFGVSPAPDGGYPNGNTAEGDQALFTLTSGIDNTAIGVVALYLNTTGQSNTAIGAGALNFNTTGGGNTATGAAALSRNSTGNANTANGSETLFENTTGSYNTADGAGALFLNTTGDHNTANGDSALYINTTGSFNTATGVQALLSNTTGNSNTANGFQALSSNATGSGNIALGYLAGSNLSTGSYNIHIGNEGFIGDDATIRIGTIGTQTATFIAGIYRPASFAGTAVYVNSNGQLGTHTSSVRFKRNIHSMDKASEAILRLRPVTFRYKHELDSEGIPQFGLVAEEVEKVNPALIARDADGKPYTVRYEAVNAMLLNEFLKEHRKVEQLTKDFESRLAEQQTQIEALTAGLQRVSAQLEVSKSAPRTADNDR